MVKLEEIKKDSVLNGIVPGQSVSIASVDPIGNDAVSVFYKDSLGKLDERMLFRSDESSLSHVETGRPWSFDGNGSDFKLAAEAHRIQLAHLFDPLMAVHTSTVEPLPHQITAVYESMLPRQPLRFLLADDPGSGKTIMAGLLIRELMIRGDLKRMAIKTASAFIKNRGQQPRLNQNRLIFLSADVDAVATVYDNSKRYLAWESIIEDKDVLNLDQHRIKEAIKNRNDYDDRLNGVLGRTIDIFFI